MGSLNRVYGIETRRSWRRRMGVSTVLALAVGACWLGAIAVVVVTPLLYGDVGGGLALLLFLARWAAAGLLLLLAVALLLHYAPERRSPLQWVTFGAVAIMAGWLVMSLGFGHLPARDRRLQLDLRRARHRRRADRLPVRGRGRVPRRRPARRAVRR